MKKTYVLKDLLLLTKDGEWGKSEPVQGDEVEMFVIRGTDFLSIRHGDLSKLPIRYIAERHARRKTLEPDDILIETAGGTRGRPTGRTVFLDASLFERSTLPLTCASFSRFLRIDTSKAFPAYVYWYLQFLYKTGQMTQHQIQHTGVSRFQYTRFAESVEIPLPGLSEQKYIADILSTYDDLIDNNHRRILLLEESIHLLYKEWFVHLKFPGHEQLAVVDGAPEGWEHQPLSKTCKLVMGQSPKSEYYNSDGQGLPFHQGVKNFGNRYIKHEVFCTKKNRIAEPGDILCSVRAPVGRLNITLEQIIIGRGLAAINNLRGFQSFQFYQLKSHFFKEDLIGGGAIFASVTKKQLSSQMLLVPPDPILRLFEENSIPVDQQIANLHNQNIRLREARDRLLPRLMSGTITV